MATTKPTTEQLRQAIRAAKKARAQALKENPNLSYRDRNRLDRAVEAAERALEEAEGSTLERAAGAVKRGLKRPEGGPTVTVRGVPISQAGEVARAGVRGVRRAAEAVGGYLAGHHEAPPQANWPKERIRARLREAKAELEYRLRHHPDESRLDPWPYEPGSRADELANEVNELETSLDNWEENNPKKAAGERKPRGAQTPEVGTQNIPDQGPARPAVAPRGTELQKKIKRIYLKAERERITGPLDAKTRQLAYGAFAAQENERKRKAGTLTKKNSLTARNLNDVQKRRAIEQYRQGPYKFKPYEGLVDPQTNEPYKVLISPAGAPTNEPILWEGKPINAGFGNITGAGVAAGWQRVEGRQVEITMDANAKVREIYGYDAQQRAEMRRKLGAAGYYGEGKPPVGSFPITAEDEAAWYAAVLDAAMNYAHGNKVTVEQMIDQRAAAGLGATTQDKSLRISYSPEDSAALAQEVAVTVYGRNATPEEKSFLHHALYANEALQGQLQDEGMSGVFTTPYPQTTAGWEEFFRKKDPIAAGSFQMGENAGKFMELATQTAFGLAGKPEAWSG